MLLVGGRLTNRGHSPGGEAILPRMDLRADIEALVDVGRRAPHYDAGRGGIALGQKAEARRAAFGNLVRRPIGPLEPLFWAELAVLVCCVLRLASLSGLLLTVVQFVPTVLLIVAVALLLDIALAPTRAGENDNATGAALALRLV